MSFYLTLSSDGTKEMFRNNHGGDFRVQLDHILDMRSQAWEVALVEMIYTGQAFPNIPTQDSVVVLNATDKSQFENDYILTLIKQLTFGFHSLLSVTTLLPRVEGIA